METKYTVNQNNIAFQSRLKSLNALNPISYYSNRYFRRASKRSQSNIEPICKDLYDAWSVHWAKQGKNIVSIDEFANKTKQPENYVLFLHGTAQNTTNYQHLYKSILSKDLGVWAVEFRSYGVNKTSPISEDKFRKDIEIAYQHLLKSKNIKPENVIVIGHSMGGALAANFASRHKDIKSLILVSPLYNAANLGEKFMEHKTLGEGIPKFLSILTDKIKPLKWLYGLRFSTINKLKHIKAPTYLIQSKNDSVTPIRPARGLAKNARRCGILEQFITLPTGGHKVDNDKVEVISKILDSFVK